MIRINLLPFRLVRKKEETRRQIFIFLLSLALISLALGLWGFQLSRSVSRVKAEVARVKAESAIYKKQADKAARIKKDLAVLEDKLAVIKDLKKRKNEQQILLEELAHHLVETKMWLSNVTASAQTVSLKGIAFDDPTIAAFMRNLESSRLFGGVDLKMSKTKVFGDNIRLKEFEISCTKNRSASEAGQAEQGGKSKKGKK